MDSLTWPDLAAAATFLSGCLSSGVLFLEAGGWQSSVDKELKGEICSEINLMTDLVLFHCCHKYQPGTV